MIVWCCMESCGSGARALPGDTCRNDSGRGRRCISVFVTGAMTVRSTGYWSACTFDSTRKDCSIWTLGGSTARRSAQPDPLQVAGKGGSGEPLDHALGRSRGGLTFKIQMVCDSNCVSLRFTLSPGQASDIDHAQPLLDRVQVPGKPGQSHKRSRCLLADKGYGAEQPRHYCDRYRMQPVIPLRTMPRKPRPGLHRLFDRPKYRQRNIIERMFGWLKENRRIGTRYDKLARSFSAMVTLSCSLCCMRQYFSYKT